MLHCEERFGLDRDPVASVLFGVPIVEAPVARTVPAVSKFLRRAAKLDQAALECAAEHFANFGIGALVRSRPGPFTVREISRSKHQGVRVGNVQGDQDRQGGKGTTAALARFDEAELMEGDVTVRVEYSALNYKDGLAVTGKAPVVRRFPMIAGIDLAGTVEQSSHPQWKAGDKVICTGWGMGETHLGAYAEMARVKGETPSPRGRRRPGRRAASLRRRTWSSSGSSSRTSASMSSAIASATSARRLGDRSWMRSARSADFRSS